MAAQHAAHAETETAADAMRANGLLRIAGAVGRVTAAALHAEHDFQGCKGNAVNTDQKDGYRLHEPFSMAKFPKKATRYRRNQPNHWRAGNELMDDFPTDVLMK
jgi:hypothetical protein